MVVAKKRVDPTTLAIEQMREIGRYIEKNASALVGDITSLYVLEDGIRITCTLDPGNAVPTVEVSKNYIVIDK